LEKSPEGELAAFLSSAFSVNEARAFLTAHTALAPLVKKLPDEGASREQYSAVLVDALVRAGMARGPFFEALSAARPKRLEDVTRCAARFRVVLDPQPPPPTAAPSEPPTRRIGLLAAGVVAVVVVAGLAAGALAAGLATFAAFNASQQSSPEGPASVGTVLLPRQEVCVEGDRDYATAGPLPVVAVDQLLEIAVTGRTAQGPVVTVEALGDGCTTAEQAVGWSTLVGGDNVDRVWLGAGTRAVLHVFWGDPGECFSVEVGTVDDDGQDHPRAGCP
jgi:hypothetical protein